MSQNYIKNFNFLFQVYITHGWQTAVIGQYFFTTPTMTANAYLQMLGEFAIDKRIRRAGYFQQNGASPHFACTGHAFFDQTLCWGVSPIDGVSLVWHIPAKLSSAESRSRHQEWTLIFMIVLS